MLHRAPARCGTAAAAATLSGVTLPRPRLRRVLALALAACSAASCRRGGGGTATDGGPIVPDGAAPMREGSEFLRLDVDLDARYPLHAKIVRAGNLYLEHAGGPVVEPSNRSAMVEVRVIDPDRTSDPIRPRVLCESATERVAVHVDVDDLALVATAGAVAVSGGTPPESLPQAMAGIVLAPGAVLRPSSALDGELVHVELERPGLHGGGWVRRDRVDFAFAPGALPPAQHGAMARSVSGRATLAAMPGGVPLAELSPAGGAVQVFALGSPVGEQALVRLELADAHVIGWIASASLGPETLPLATTGVRAPVISAADLAGDGPSVALTRGTILRGTALRRAVGVVTADARYACVDGCDGDAPVVRVPACTGVLELTATREG